MGVETFLSQYSFRLGKNWLAIALALLGMIFFVYGLISLLGSASKNEDIKFSHQDLTPKLVSLIQVDIEGAVVKPGVYKLRIDSIIQDALVASGGLTSEADRDYISKNINLASKLTDGSKIYIPKLGDISSKENLQQGGSLSTLININSATEKELDTLPGVGSVTAGKIISNRPYLAINELIDKNIISSKVFTQIKDKISTY
jgi:competence protein ComEA